jgi:hypothetical protein
MSETGAAAEIPPGLREPRNRVNRKAIWYWSATAAVGTVVVLGIEVGIAAIFNFDTAWWIVLGVSAVLLLARVLVMPRWRYRVHRWEITDDALYTRTGWFSVHWRIAPISRIQTIDSERNLTERIFGLANVTATTASAAGHIKIHGLDVATADRMQAELSLATARIPGDAT